MEAFLRAILLLLFLSRLFVIGISDLFDSDFPIGISDATETDFETDFSGEWELVSANSGVSAMHLVVMPNNKAIMFDATAFGPSEVLLPAGKCRQEPYSMAGKQDCWAHSVEFDIDTGRIRPLKILTNTWCSSGGLSADGTLVQTGGWNDGGRAVRSIRPCDDCDWNEYPTSLSAQRWYSTQQILPDGSFIVIGGRRQFSYEFVPKPGESNWKTYKLPFLFQTTDQIENNLYPFVHLSTDGNLFIFANNRSILLNPINQSILRHYPPLPGGARNYPASGMSVLLPIKLNNVRTTTGLIPAEVLICGGAPPEAGILAAKQIFLWALSSCGRLTITDPKTTWRMENMPTPRVMGDVLTLPNEDVLMINGAKRGASGWKFARDPNYQPVLYRSKLKPENRFKTLKPSGIPRMYHSTSAVLPDGRILVAGSNTNGGYNFTGVMYPTELRVEKFRPPYLDLTLTIYRPIILPDFSPKTIRYGQEIQIRFFLGLFGQNNRSIKVTMYAPPFTTHGYSMNQRLVVVVRKKVEQVGLDLFDVTVVAPPTPSVAPPGYYMLFVVHGGVPSKAVWVQMVL